MKPFALCLALLAGSPALAEIHEVRMFNRNDHGAMIYEPDFLRVAPGDSVRFIPEQSSHNAATIDGMIPAGASPFKSKINQDFTVTLTEPGRYGIKCSPHFAMGMVMWIEVGEGAPGGLSSDLPADLPKRARARFEQILAAHRED
ncbi:pseudoazurin [Pseudodonghicola xiamenensis]|uniref:Pseudoazurin n=1 Tax=Pseudodonghicola xiamenensis TaxID=337702 RepID=A0A8J3H477_9RHOB|nr:pseudoazurin [Pseudodonghicola xiamenensis]GHG78976.1 pseudoazurin [Pseudodonghicola xiamenensis]